MFGDYSTVNQYYYLMFIYTIKTIKDIVKKILVQVKLSVSSVRHETQ